MMQDFPPSTTNANDLSGKMDSNTNANTNNNQTNPNDGTSSQGALNTLKTNLPLALSMVKWVGSNTKTFFISGQFRQTIRSPVQFVNPRHLAIPKTVGDALTRLSTNWGFYKSNYAIITFLCCFGWLFSSPSSLIVLAILFLMWFYTIKTSSQTLSIGESKYGPMQKYMFSMVITLMAMLFFGIVGTLIGGISVGAGISSIHAACHVRPTSEHEQLRDLNDIELTNSNTNTSNNKDSTVDMSIKYNETISNNNGELTSVNGLEILHFSDNESYPVNDTSLTSSIPGDNNNTQTSIFEKMVNNGGNNGTDDDQPELGAGLH